MNSCAVVFLLLALPVFSQDMKRASAQDFKEEMKTFQFEHSATPTDVIQLVRDLVQNVRLDHISAMNTVVIHGYAPGAADKAIALLKKYDLPRPQVDFTAYMVLSQEAKIPVTGGKPIPPELQSAIDQMKRTFPDRAFVLRDIVESHASESVTVESRLADSSYWYTLSLMQIMPSRESKSVRIGQFLFSIKGCNNDSCRPLSITNLGVVVQEGKKLVFGKLPVEIFVREVSPGKSAQVTDDLYLVITAKIQDPAQ